MSAVAGVGIPEVPDVLRGLRTIEPSELREGDIIFCSRPGFLQRLCSSVGDLWRHVGIALVIDTADGPQMGMVEVDGDRFVTRTMAQVQDAYVWLAAGRVKDPAAVGPAVEWARYLVGSEHAYAWDDAVLAGFVAITRMRIGDVDPVLAARLVRRASAAASPRWADRRVTHTCSSFIYFAFNSGDGRHRLVVDLEQTQLAAAAVQEQKPAPALRAGRGSRIDPQQLVEAARVVIGAVGGGTKLDSANPEAMGRWVMPGDLWRSPSLGMRAIVPTTATAGHHAV